MSDKDKFKEFQRPDFGIGGITRPAFSRGAPPSLRPGASSGIDLFEVMRNMGEERFSDPRADDGITGRRLCLVAHYEYIDKEEIRDPAVVAQLEIQAAAQGETLTQIMVVYGPVAGGTSAMLSTPLDQDKLPDDHPVKSQEADFTRIIRYPSFYALPREPDPIIGHPAYVEFADKDLHRWGWFLNMIGEEPGQLSSVGGGSTGELSPSKAFNGNSKPVPIGDIGPLDDDLTPPLPPESGETYHSLMGELSAQIDLPVEIAYAFFDTEAGGIGFCARDRSGKGKSPIALRFEPHTFARTLWRHRKKRTKKAYESFVSDPKSWWVSPESFRKSPGDPKSSIRMLAWGKALKKKWTQLGHKHGKVCTDKDLEELQYAANRWSEEIAFESSSFGLPQIMGFHYKNMGFSSAKQMYLAFSTNEAIQIRAFFRFVQQYRGGKLLTALRRRDWQRAVEIYNGCRGHNCVGYTDKMKKFSRRYASTPPKNRVLLAVPPGEKDAGFLSGLFS